MAVSVFGIPLFPTALEILAKYANHPITTENELFPPVISNQMINAYLKKIAKISEIDKKLAFYSGRHNYTTIETLANSVLIESVS